MIKQQNKLCRDCQFWFQITNLLQVNIQYGYCMKHKQRNILRYQASSCIVDNDGNLIA